MTVKLTKKNERWAIFVKKGRKWIPWHSDGKSYASKSYAQDKIDTMQAGFRMCNTRVDMKVKAVIATNCTHCGAKLVE